jgi:hypothetical protein
MRLSQQNFIGTIGFAILAMIGMALAYQSNLVRPLDLLAHVDSTTATLYNEYTERTSTRRGISTTSYEISYTFEVNGKKYSGRCPIDDTPREQMTVYYDRRDPTTNGMQLCGHAYIDLGFFGVMVVVLLACIGAIILHIRSGRQAEGEADRSE